MEGLIIKSISGEYDCLVNGDIITTKPLGIFRHHNMSPKVGDKVLIEKGMISKILPRKNDLIRPFVSNVDKALIVTSLVEPDLNLNLLDSNIAEGKHRVGFKTALEFVNKILGSGFEIILETEKVIGFTKREIVIINYKTLKVLGLLIMCTIERFLIWDCLKKICLKF